MNTARCEHCGYAIQFVDAEKNTVVECPKCKCRTALSTSSTSIADERDRKERLRKKQRRAAAISTVILYCSWKFGIQDSSPKHDQAQKEMHQIAAEIQPGKPIQYAPKELFLQPLVLMINEVQSNCASLTLRVESIGINDDDLIRSFSDTNLMAVELVKHTKARRLIAGYRDTNQQIMARAFMRISKLDVPEEIKRQTTRGLQESIQNKKMESFFSIRASIYSNRMELIEFMLANFDDQTTPTGKLGFRHATNSAIFNEHVARVEKARLELESAEEASRQAFQQSKDKILSQ